MCQRTRVRIEYHFYKNQNTNVRPRRRERGGRWRVDYYRARTPFRTLRPLSRALYSV